MQYPTADQASVYRSPSCRRVFSSYPNVNVRKKKVIRSVIQQHGLAVSHFSTEKLVDIIQYLLQEGIFGSSAVARTRFPQLFRPLASPPVAPPSPSQASSNMADLMNSLNKALATGIYSDLQLISSKKTYAAHRVIVCLRSSVISKSCDFKNASATKDDSGVSIKAEPLVFDFLDDDPQSVDCVIQYFYQLDYTRPDYTFGLTPGAEQIHSDETAAPADITDSDDANLVLHVKVYALAEKYDIPHLKELSLSKFEEAVRQHWKSDRFPDAAREAYTSTIQEDEGMRTAVVKTFYAHRELLDQGHIRELLQELSQLTYDLLIHHHTLRKEPISSVFPRYS